jgi:hypothetical protein
MTATTLTATTLTAMIPTRAHLAAFATVVVLLTMLTAPFTFVAMAASGSSAGTVGEKPMCFAAGVGCRAGPSLEIALFAPRH